MPILDIDKYSNLKDNGQTCPYCGGFIFLIPRTWYDRWLNFISLGTKRKFRFKCRSCHKELIKNSGE